MVNPEVVAHVYQRCLFLAFFRRLLRNYATIMSYCICNKPGVSNCICKEIGSDVLLIGALHIGCNLQIGFLYFSIAETIFEGRFCKMFLHPIGQFISANKKFLVDMMNTEGSPCIEILNHELPKAGADIECVVAILRLDECIGVN